MINRLFTFVFACVYSMSIFASPDTGVKQIFDEYTYVMEVEGGSLDPKLGESARETLEANILKLVDDGVSKNTILEESFSLVKNPILKSELLGSLKKLQSGKISDQVFLNLIDQNLSSQYQHGASWGGRIDIVVGITVFLAIIIVPRLIFIKNCPREYRAGDGVCERPEDIM